MKSKSFNLKIGAVCAAVAMIFGIAAVPAVAASANSAQKDWQGSSASGMMITDENCPVEVESEVLTFNINDFPSTYYYEQAELKKYEASVTAHYNFYNPADYDVDMTLAFPFGEFPTYVGDNLNDGDKYLVTADGGQIKSSVRHTLSYGVFNAEKDVAKIQNDYKDGEFFKHDIPVHYYKCRFARYGSDYTLYLNAKYDKEKTAIFYGVENDYDQTPPYAIYQHTSSENSIVSAKRGTELYLFVVGEDFEDGPQFSYGPSFPLFGNNVVDEDDVLISKQDDITFKDLMLAYRDTNSSVSEIDWYNAAIDYVDSYGYLHYSMTNSLMRWFEYRLTIPAGGRLANEVTAPLYPDINGYYSPSKYSYQYLLSPAKCWASFGSLEIVINTPYYLLDNNLKDFEKEEGGYRLKLDGLPEGELEFTLCSSKAPASDSWFETDKTDRIVFTVFACFTFIPQTIAAIPLIIVFAVTGQFSSKPKEKKL